MNFISFSRRRVARCFAFFLLFSTFTIFAFHLVIFSHIIFYCLSYINNEIFSSDTTQRISDSMYLNQHEKYLRLTLKRVAWSNANDEASRVFSSSFFTMTTNTLRCRRPSTVVRRCVVVIVGEEMTTTSTQKNIYKFYDVKRLTASTQKGPAEREEKETQE